MQFPIGGGGPNPPQIPQTWGSPGPEREGETPKPRGDPPPVNFMGDPTPKLGEGDPTHPINWGGDTPIPLKLEEGPPPPLWAPSPAPSPNSMSTYPGVGFGPPQIPPRTPFPPPRGKKKGFILVLEGGWGVMGFCIQKWGILGFFFGFDLSQLLPPPFSPSGSLPKIPAPGAL